MAQHSFPRYSIEPLPAISRSASKLNFHRPKANNQITSTFAFVSSKLWKTIPTNSKKAAAYTFFYNQYKLYKPTDTNYTNYILLFYITCLYSAAYSLSTFCHLFTRLLFIYINFSTLAWLRRDHMTSPPSENKH